jgi:hypothetical protein
MELCTLYNKGVRGVGKFNEGITGKITMSRVTTDKAMTERQTIVSSRQNKDLRTRQVWSRAVSSVGR